MSYKIPKQPPKRDPNIAWDDAAPGLYDDGEVLVKLDDDIHAAVSVEHKWLPNGAGVTFFGTARWCDPSGETHLCPDGNHVETLISVTVSPGVLAQHDLADLKKDVLLVLLGEEQQVKIELDDGVTNAIALHETVKLNANIRHAAKTVSALHESADPLTLLS